MRSGFYPHLPRRIIRITVIKGSPERVGSTRYIRENGPILKKVAQAYSGYVGSLKNLPRALDIALSRDPEYYTQNFLGDLIEDAHMKLASSHFAATLSEPMVPEYLYNIVQSGVLSVPKISDVLPSHATAKALLGPVI